MMKYWIIRLCNKIYKVIGVTKYYQTKFGIKVFNRKRSLSINYIDEEPVWVSAECLFLGVDGIKDKETLLGCPCDKSPHRYFIESCENGDLKGCDYIKRERSGTLDGRDSFFISEDDHIATFKRKIDEYREMRPVLVYEVKGTLYIADGKHRAAYLSSRLSDIPIRRIKLDASDIEYFKNICKMMLRNEEQYLKNITLIESILEENLND